VSEEKKENQGGLLLNIVRNLRVENVDQNRNYFMYVIKRQERWIRQKLWIWMLPSELRSFLKYSEGVLFVREYCFRFVLTVLLA